MWGLLERGWGVAVVCDDGNAPISCSFPGEMRL